MDSRVQIIMESMSKAMAKSMEGFQHSLQTKV